MMLSPHFSLNEMLRSDTADRFKIDNSCHSELVLANLILLCNKVLEPVRAEFGPIRPNSGFRCIDLNRKIGSKDNSQHVLGQAVDFEVAGVSNGDLAHWCKDNLEFDQLILEYYSPKVPSSGWVHISYAKENRNQVLTINKQGVHIGIQENNDD